jgi:hypothetical protein
VRQILLRVPQVGRSLLGALSGCHRDIGGC